MKINEVAGDRAPPTTAYHITSESNAEDIMAVGLLPRNDAQLDWYTEGSRAYLVTNTKDMGEVAHWLYAKMEANGNYDEPLVLLKIDTTGLPLKYESGFWYSVQRIPPDRITNLGEAGLAQYV